MRERRRLTKILASNPRANNGSHLGGLAYALQQGLRGYQINKDDEQYSAAQEALAKGLAPTTTPNEGEMGPIRPRGGRLTDALASLSGMEGNPYAAQLSSQLGLQQAAAEAQRANEARQFERDSSEFNRRQGLEHQQSLDLLGQRNSFTADQNSLNRDARLNEANVRRQGQGKYYAVQTGSGTMLVDKGTGMATMLGIDENGSPVQIGQPFQPNLTTTGQPLPLPQGAGGSHIQPGPVPVEPQGSVSPIMPPSLAADAQAAVTRATEDAKLSVEAERDLPGKIANADQMLDALENLENHPGLESGTGFSSYLPAVRGSERIGFDVALKQAQGKVFLQAFESLKGGGHITEIEGQKGEQAIARLDAAQSTEAFLEAVRDLRAVVIAGRERAVRAAAGNFGQQGGESTPPVAPVAPPPGWSIRRVE